jgi:hypothetical protein
MISRLGASGLGVIFCVASLLAPNDTFARGGGGGGHGGAVGHASFGGRAGGLTGRVSMPSGYRSPASPSTTQESPRTIPSPPHEHQLGFGSPSRHERGFGVPLFLPGGSFAYGPYYGGAGQFPYYGPVPFGDAGQYSDQLPYSERDYVTGAIPGSVNPFVIYRPGCRTQTVTVPSEGDERAINIVRC